MTFMIRPYSFGAGGGGGTPIGGGTLMYLLNWDGGNGSTSFTDESSYAHTITGNGSVAQSTAQTKFGASVLSLNGSSQWLTLPHGSEWDCGAVDFTHGGWFYGTSFPNDFNCIINKDGGGTSWSFCVYVNSSNKLGGYVGDGSSAGWAQLITSTTNVSANAWHHYEFNRSGSTIYLFLDGNLEASDTLTGTIVNGTQPCFIGRQNSGGRWFSGYLDNQYGSRGYARNTSSFTPPTLPITA